ncbi:MAG: glycoside hydrolase family 95 protein, partial [Bacteroidales bacterium]|nr:glycoside hydrolase family 95 protein [Bacteroidales bacterium]
MKKVFYYALFMLLIACQPHQEKTTELKLWYDTPAADWMTEALPIGNAYMGAMVFGQPKQEHIQFT